MLTTLMMGGAAICAVQAVRSKRLLASALWLAGLSTLMATLLYSLNAAQVAVLELSVGAGLVTVLFVFAINFAVPIERNDGASAAGPALPRWVAWGLPILTLLCTIPLLITLPGQVTPQRQPPFTTILWQQRSLDLLVQVGLIFSGVLGVVGLLAEGQVDRPPRQHTLREHDRGVPESQTIGMPRHTPPPVPVFESDVKSDVVVLPPGAPQEEVVCLPHP
jgi:uncharacterized MnhB-related membrane protein